MPKSKAHNLNINIIPNPTPVCKTGCYNGNPVPSLLQLNTQRMLMNLCVGCQHHADRYPFVTTCVAMAF